MKMCNVWVPSFIYTPKVYLLELGYNLGGLCAAGLMKMITMNWPFKGRN